MFVSIVVSILVGVCIIAVVNTAIDTARIANKVTKLINSLEKRGFFDLDDEDEDLTPENDMEE